jgi:hypothetical protein
MLFGGGSNSASSIGGTLAHHGLWTLQLSLLDRPEEGFDKRIRKPKILKIEIWA